MPADLGAHRDDEGPIARHHTMNRARASGHTHWRYRM